MLNSLKANKKAILRLAADAIVATHEIDPSGPQRPKQLKLNSCFGMEALFETSVSESKCK